MNLTHIQGNLFGGLDALEESGRQEVYAVKPWGRIYAYAHCIAEDGRWGTGIAPFFMDVFGCGQTVNASLREYRDMHEGQGFSPWALVLPVGNFALWQSKREPVIMAHLVTKKCTYGKPTLETMEDALEHFKFRMRETIDLCGKWNETECVVRIPKIGCGLDRLNWPDVENIIRQTFYDTNFNFEVYSLKKGN